ncbi:MAG TPA: hypothetical protein VL979_11165 [Solirubrobacteraceae bacterium]|jgi:hypothetical protein|nr:hypothetical protein [Solirubrobacteraceae bacterium]
MTGPIVKLMRVCSLVLCAIVLLSFGAFVLERTSGASQHQQEEVSQGAAAHSHEGSSRHSAVRNALDEASASVTSPFAGLLSGTSSEWASRGGKVVLALLLYGFGLGYLARVLRVRV